MQTEDFILGDREVIDSMRHGSGVASSVLSDGLMTFGLDVCVSKIENEGELTGYNRERAVIESPIEFERLLILVQNADKRIVNAAGATFFYRGDRYNLKWRVVDPAVENKQSDDAYRLNFKGRQLRDAIQHARETHRRHNEN